MNFKHLLAAVSILALGQSTAFADLSQGYGYEFSVNLLSSKRGDGVSGSGQSAEYAYYPQLVPYTDYPYNEAAFMAQSAYYGASVNGSNLDVAGGSSQQWGFGIKGRYKFPDAPYFAEAGFSRQALSFDPYVLSTAANYDAMLTTLSAVAGMYVTNTAVVDLGLAYTNAEVDVAADVRATTFNLHGKILLPVTDRMFTALELTATLTTADAGSQNSDTNGYVARCTWYFTHRIDASLAFGRVADTADPATDYKTQDFSVGWFFEPEVKVSLDFLQSAWDDGSKDKYTTLRFTQRL